VSTGAGDWLESNGELRKVEGGYRFTSEKPFASGSPLGDLLITSGRYEDPAEGPQVLHFALPFNTEGVRRGNDWDTHGMRGTGSSTVSIEDAFIADAAISLKRPRGPYHPAFHVISIIALPIIMSVYTGIAERACEIAFEKARARREDPSVQYLAGELRTLLFVVRALFDAHVNNANEFDVAPEFEPAARSVEAKTALAESVVKVVDKAMELAGGEAFFRRTGLEQLRRDVAGAKYHPLQEKRQHLFSGRGALGLDLVSQALSNAT
jgi:alkylation response protein AidB-like acyl-CoA dehydrogenase